MTLQYGLLLGFLGTSLTIIGFTIAYIVYERHRKNIERIERRSKEKNPFVFGEDTV